MSGLCDSRALQEFDEESNRSNRFYFMRDLGFDDSVASRDECMRFGLGFENSVADRNALARDLNAHPIALFDAVGEAPQLRDELLRGVVLLDIAFTSLFPSRHVKALLLLIRSWFGHGHRA